MNEVVYQCASCGAPVPAVTATCQRCGARFVKQTFTRVIFESAIIGSVCGALAGLLGYWLRTDNTFSLWQASGGGGACLGIIYAIVQRARAFFTSPSYGFGLRGGYFRSMREDAAFSTMAFGFAVWEALQAAFRHRLGPLSWNQ